MPCLSIIYRQNRLRPRKVTFRRLALLVVYTNDDMYSCMEQLIGGHGCLQITSPGDLITLRRSRGAKFARWATARLLTNNFFPPCFHK
jgi:hypothetical protein